MDWQEILKQNEQTFWGYLGMKLLRADKERVDLKVEAGEKHLNSMGIVHGGVLSSMMDQAMGILVTAAKEGVQGVTTHLNVNFLAPMHKGELIASAFPIQETYRTMTLRAEIRNQEGTLGCIANATFRVPKH